jgi:hypothetical protein
MSVGVAPGKSGDAWSQYTLHKVVNIRGRFR